MRPYDTHPKAHEIQIGIYRRMTTGRRAEIALEMSESVRQMTTDGIRQRHPEYSEKDVLRALVALLYGKDLARRVWPGVEIPLP